MKIGNEWDLWIIGSIWLAWTVSGLTKKLGYACAGTILASFAASALISWAIGVWLEQEALGMALAFVGAVVLSCLFKHHCADRFHPSNAAGKPLISEKKKAKRLSRRERRAQKKRTRGL